MSSRCRSPSASAPSASFIVAELSLALQGFGKAAGSRSLTGMLASGQLKSDEVIVVRAEETPETVPVLMTAGAAGDGRKRVLASAAVVSAGVAAKGKQRVPAAQRAKALDVVHQAAEAAEADEDEDSQSSYETLYQQLVADAHTVLLGTSNGPAAASRRRENFYVEVVVEHRRRRFRADFRSR